MPNWSNFGAGVAGSAVSLGLNTLESGLTGLINNAFYKRNLQLQTDAQKDLIDYQNQYNSPTAQMQRLQEAGLNPNLVYGSAAPAGVSGNAAAPSGSGFPASHGTNDVAAAAAHMAQMRLSSSAEQLNIANADKASAEAERTRLDSKYYPELVESTISKAKQEVQTLAAQEKLHISQAKEAEARAILDQAEAAYKAGELSLIEFRKQEIVANTALLSEKRNTEVKQQAYLTEATGTQAQLGNYYYYMAAIADVQSKWDAIVKSEANAEKAAEVMKRELSKTAEELDITGTRTMIWINVIMNWLMGAARAAGDAGGMAALFKLI